jgi:drug/metabolite transporter (DMT)-like permease
LSWFLLALGSAFGVATADFLIKRFFSDRPVAETAMLRFLGLAPLSLGLLLFLPWPQVSPAFFIALALALPGEMAATLLYQRAIQVSPLALAQPFLAFTPVFALATGFVVLQELPSLLGLAGVGLVAAGAYGLNLHQARHGWRQPLLAVFREPGSWMMLAASAIYAYTAVLGKKALLASSPLFVVAVYPLAMCLVMGGVLWARGRLSWGWARRPWPAAGVGVSMCLMAVCHFLAIAQVEAAYMISVKRLSLLIVMLYGGIFLGEERLGQHLAAGGAMVAGAALILLWG